MRKLCKSLRKSMRESVWENSGKFSPFLLFCSVYDLMQWIMFGFHIIMHILFNVFYTSKLFGFYLLDGYFYTFST